MTDFSPWTALAGGALVGAGAVLLMLANGRILGIAGIVGGVLDGSRGLPWRMAFIVGMVLPGAVMGLTGNLHLEGNGLGLGLLVLSGFLVGFGTRLGNGCTSGHGICGLARLSPRSLAAVATFMAVAAIVVYVRRHLMGA